MLLATIRTSVGFWDIGDLQTVAGVAGIPYPTGFPGYSIIAWLWAHAIPIGSVAARVNALSAVSVACASAVVAAVALLLDVTPAIAAIGGWSFAFAHTIWVRGTYADVHPLGFAVAFAAVALALRWTMRDEPRTLVAAIVLAAAAIAIDNTTVLILAGGVIVTFGRAWPLALIARAVAIGVVIVVAAYAYLPLRSAYVTSHRLDPTLALGIQPGRPFWDDHHPSTPEGFRSLVAGSEWVPGATIVRILTPASIGATIGRIGTVYRNDEATILPLLALAGIALVVARRPFAGIGLVASAVVPAIFGATYQAEADPGRYVFALYAVTSVGAAIALDRARRRRGARSRGAMLAIACGLSIPLFAYDAARANDIVADRGNTDAAALGDRVADATRDGAVVVAPWNWATPLAYRAYVDRAMGTRVVVCGMPLDYLDEYARWAREHELTIVWDGPPSVPGFDARALTDGTPQVYELTPR